MMLKPLLLSWLGCVDGGRLPSEEEVKEKKGPGKTLLHGRRRSQC
jgi:hypothetical protein